VDITLVIAITMLCGTDNIMRNIPHNIVGPAKHYYGFKLCYEINPNPTISLYTTRWQWLHCSPSFRSWWCFNASIIIVFNILLLFFMLVRVICKVLRRWTKPWVWSFFEKIIHSKLSSSSCIGECFVSWVKLLGPLLKHCKNYRI
jgi:hypothetical protein